jgi:hypothetical protein
VIVWVEEQLGKGSTQGMIRPVPDCGPDSLKNPLGGSLIFERLTPVYVRVAWVVVAKATGSAVRVLTPSLVKTWVR